jgi:polysaccharide pyruvyl transferase WcaK-like protein
MSANHLTAALFNDTSAKGHQGCDLVVEQIRKGLSDQGITIAWSHQVGIDWRQAERELVNKPRVDVAIVNGEGSIHHSAQRARAQYLPALAPFFRDRLRVPGFLINSTIFELSSLAAKDLAAFTGIFVRDTGSRAELERHGITGAEVVPDLSICAQIPVSDHRIGIGATDSVLPEVTERLRAVSAERGWSYEPMQSHTPQQRWLRKLGLQRWMPNTALKPPDIANFAAAREAIITGRFHTVTLCIATRTPFVAVASNTPKIQWLIDDVFGNRSRIITCEQLQDLNIAAFKFWSAAERTLVEKVILRTKAASQDMFKKIALTARRGRENH